MPTQRPVHRLTGDLYNRPYLISPEAFSTILTYLHERNAGMLESGSIVKVQDTLDQPEKEGKIGLINIHGALTNKPIESLCGATGTSYSGIISQASYLIAEGCKKIVMDIDSGGGEAFNCFQTADELREMCDTNDVELVAYIQSMSASAAYALTCVADVVVCHPQARVGSIGVLVELHNYSEYLKKEGVSRTFVFAGENKIPYDKDGNFTESFIGKLQEDVDHLYEGFCSHVSTYTGLDMEAVKATEASVFRAEVALELGLVNSIMTHQEFASFITLKEDI